MAQQKINNQQINTKWSDWTNAISSGITVGNGTLIAKYMKIGDKVNFYFSFTLGSTSAVTGDVLLNPPVSFSPSFANGRQPIGNSNLLDSGTAARTGECHVIHTPPYDKIRISYYSVSGSYIGPNSISSTQPFTWTTNDGILCTGIYDSTG